MCMPGADRSGAVRPLTLCPFRVSLRVSRILRGAFESPVDVSTPEYAERRVGRRGLPRQELLDASIGRRVIGSAFADSA